MSRYEYFLYIAEHEKSRFCKASDYMNLYFKCKLVYNRYIADIPQCKGVIPEYPR